MKAVENGVRSEPAWLRAHPGLHDFELEKPAQAQLLRNVWDTKTAGKSDGVNENGGRTLALLRNGVLSGIRTRVIAVKGRCPRPG